MRPHHNEGRVRGQDHVYCHAVRVPSFPRPRASSYQAASPV